MDLTREHIDALRQITTPTLSNAIELCCVRPNHHGFMSPEIRCLFPDLGVMVGYAVTGRFTAAKPVVNPASRYEFWKQLLQIPAPRVLVLEDMDQPPGVGAFVGEIMATIHQKLGCAGVVTNGHLRDLDEAHSLGFHFFAAGACVSHAHVDLIDFGTPVHVGGLLVRPGDLLHGDKHGVLSVPNEVVPDLPRMTATVVEREGQILSFCKSPAFTLEGLKDFFG
jgi:4-hydroxy-4-methyl-2-oxoglutarate aldolase